MRGRIGSGSYSTINGHLASWRRENTAQATTDAPVIPDKVQAAFGQVWVMAAKNAREGLDTELNARRREMDEERGTMAAEIERLEKAMEEGEAKIARLEAERDRERQAKEEKAARITELTIENARLDERAEAAEDRAGELKDQLEALQQRLTESPPRNPGSILLAADS